MNQTQLIEAFEKGVREADMDPGQVRLDEDPDQDAEFRVEGYIPEQGAKLSAFYVEDEYDRDEFVELVRRLVEASEL